uniref:Testis-expressed protein 13 A-D N-terminal domain-containing protein n=1 Tax=Moschus moschiferus TaxID=68415 RepID=A0A8C6E2Q7_MOSMO
MALNSEDLSSGFRHGKVMAFINERMSTHAKGPEFYLENLSLSWENVEDKLRAILEDRLVPIQAKEACAWSSLALGVRFAHKQSQLHRHRVQWLHDFAGLHRSAAQALASDMKLLTAQHEVERKEAAFQLQLTQASLAEVQKERDLLKWKLFKAVRLPSPALPRPAPPRHAPPRHAHSVLLPCPPPTPQCQGRSQLCLLFSRGFGLPRRQSQSGQAWPLSVGLEQKEQVKRRRRQGPLLLLLRLLKPQEEEDRRMRRGGKLPTRQKI